MFSLWPTFVVRTSSSYSLVHCLCCCVLSRSQISYATADTLRPSTDWLSAIMVWCMCWALWQPSSPAGKTPSVLLHIIHIFYLGNRMKFKWSILNFLLAVQDEDQLFETSLNDSNFDMETQLVCMGSDLRSASDAMWLRPPWLGHQRGESGLEKLQKGHVPPLCWCVCKDRLSKKGGKKQTIFL